ncbi:hypothetical protein F5Y02DRAFT_107685 [Annulohypoxylon stygium]|nr:hypothetical protein F5Y02DRAFT_107685 [Annulohypoxylon stygium]
MRLSEEAMHIQCRSRVAKELVGIPRVLCTYLSSTLQCSMYRSTPDYARYAGIPGYFLGHGYGVLGCLVAWCFYLFLVILVPSRKKYAYPATRVVIRGRAAGCTSTFLLPLHVCLVCMQLVRLLHGAKSRLFSFAGTCHRIPHTAFEHGIHGMRIHQLILHTAFVDHNNSTGPG